MDNAINQELPADQEQLQELIRKQAGIMAKELIKTEVQNQIKQSKNDSRGPTGASRKKKSSPKTNRTTKSQTQRNRNTTQDKTPQKRGRKKEAEEHSNGTPRKLRRNGRQRSNSRSKKRKNTTKRDRSW